MKSDEEGLHSGARSSWTAGGHFYSSISADSSLTQLLSDAWNGHHEEIAEELLSDAWNGHRGEDREEDAWNGHREEDCEEDDGEDREVDDFPLSTDCFDSRLDSQLDEYLEYFAKSVLSGPART